jgi:hypothetical protein
VVAQRHKFHRNSTLAAVTWRHGDLNFGIAITIGDIATTTREFNVRANDELAGFERNFDFLSFSQISKRNARMTT